METKFKNHCACRTDSYQDDDPAVSPFQKYHRNCNWKGFLNHVKVYAGTVDRRRSYDTGRRALRVKQVCLFYGLIVFGLFSVVLAFVHLSRARRKRRTRVPVKKFIRRTDRRKKRASLKILMRRRPWRCRTGVDYLLQKRPVEQVSLNGVDVGSVAPDAPLPFR